MNTAYLVASLVAAAATVVYTFFSYRLWKTTKEQSELNRSSIELTRAMFESANKPRIGVEFGLQNDSKAMDETVFLLTGSIANYGQGEALDVEVSLQSGLRLYEARLRVGNLQSGQSRVIRDRFDVSEPLARAWAQELEKSRQIEFSITLDYKWPNDSSVSVRAGSVYCSPDEISSLVILQSAHA